MMTKKMIAAICLAGLAHVSYGAVVTSGDLVVLQVGTGAAALSSASTAESLLEYNTTAGSTAVQSVAVPTAGTYQLTVSGSATSEGQISLNNGALTLVGYGTAPGTASVTGTATTTAVRKAISYDLTSDLQSGPSAVATTTSFSANNIRGGVAANGGFYLSGANTGIVYQPTGGSGAGTIVSTSATNTRAINDFGGNVFFSTGSGTTTRGIYELTGEPTSAGTATATQIIATGSASSPYDFYINPAGTVAYVADSAAGIQKYTIANGVATLAYTAAITNGASGLAVDTSTANPTLYYVTGNGAVLGDVIDNGTAFSTATTLQTAATNTVFRDVSLSPVSAIPEPASLAAIGIGGLSMLRRRRRSI